MTTHFEPEAADKRADFSCEQRTLVDALLCGSQMLQHRQHATSESLCSGHTRSEVKGEDRKLDRQTWLPKAAALPVIVATVVSVACGSAITKSPELPVSKAYTVKRNQRIQSAPRTKTARNQRQVDA